MVTKILVIHVLINELWIPKKLEKVKKKKQEKLEQTLKDEKLKKIQELKKMGEKLKITKSHGFKK